MPARCRPLIAPPINCMNKTLRFAALLLLAAFNSHAAELLNASYDVSRGLFEDINPAFAAQWRTMSGDTLVIRQSHGGSSKQARAVAEGLAADVVTLNQTTDIEMMRKAGLVAADWRQRLPYQASPYYSLPLFLVREGNPKKIRDWSDLIRPGTQVIFPNPKTSGNGRYTYLAAYAFALASKNKDPQQAKNFVAKLLANVPVFDTGGRGATTTFIERNIGDVLVTFEAEVAAIRNEYGRSRLEAVVPSLSLRADFPVAVVDKVVDRKGTRPAATAYLQFLFSEAGQDIIARHYNRVHNEVVAAKYRAQFPPVKLVTVEEAFGGWDAVTRDHLSDGGILDQALAKAPAH